MHTDFGQAPGASSAKRCVRIEDYGLLIDFYLAVSQVADMVVDAQDGAGRGLLRVDQAEATRDRAFAEQALAVAENHRELPDT
jgi:hypothetical protein